MLFQMIPQNCIPSSALQSLEINWSISLNGSLASHCCTCVFRACFKLNTSDLSKYSFQALIVLRKCSWKVITSSLSHYIFCDIFGALWDWNSEQLPKSSIPKTGLLLSLLIFEMGDNIYSLPLQPKGGADPILVPCGTVQIWHITEHY